MHMREANRMKRLPPYLFTIVDNLKQEVKAQGMDVIDLSMGNPDLAPPHVVHAMREAMDMKGIHRYSKFNEKIEKDLRRAIAPVTGSSEYGEGYVGFALVSGEPIMQKAVTRIKPFLEAKD